MIQPFALEPGAGTTVCNPAGEQFVFKLRGKHSGGAMTVFESEWPYVLEGEMRFRLGDDA